MQLITLAVQTYIKVESRLLVRHHLEIDVGRIEHEFHREARKGRANLFEETNDRTPIN